MAGAKVQWLAVRAKWRPLIARWKRERERLHDCLAVPVGAKPDGVSWTGFVSVGDDCGYALIFRELNARSGWELDLRPYFQERNLAASVLGGGGTASIDGGILHVDIPARLGYVWLSLTRR